MIKFPRNISEQHKKILHTKVSKSQELFSYEGVFGLHANEKAIIVKIYKVYHGKAINPKTIPSQVDGVPVEVIQDNGDN